MRKALRISSLVFVAAGVAILNYTCLVRAEAWIYQRWGEREVEQPAKSVPAGLVGHIAIRRVGISAVVAEGSDETTLRRAVGHIASTPLPGEPGNVGLAGHRDTFFRALRNIRAGDLIVLTTPRGEFQYSVVSIKVVKPKALDVLDPTSEEILTLVTCYPFYFVGSAPNRFIVRAKRVRGQS
ncbi:MAG: class D sortase [Bryobacteraceae bacterium]|jgi:sortase A